MRKLILALLAFFMISPAAAENLRQGQWIRSLVIFCDMADQVGDVLTTNATFDFATMLAKLKEYNALENANGEPSCGIGEHLFKVVGSVATVEGVHRGDGSGLITYYVVEVLTTNGQTFYIASPYPVGENS